MANPDGRVGLRPVVMLAFLIAIGFATAAAVAQDAKKSNAADIFDDDAKEEKAADTKKASDASKTRPGSDRDTINFTQQNVAAQMTELEERMFRLSEALASLEPENASRLRLALKFSREELILAQMKETQGLLKDAQLGKAESEVKELLAKLEHLRQLLLAEDLDFQMKLARLRQMRETMARLDRIITEEKRELAWSRQAVELLALPAESERKAEAAPGRFLKLAADQNKNRAESDALAAASARLGDSGVPLQKDLIHAASAMQSAESDLAKTAAEAAARNQREALRHLLKSRGELNKATETLLVEIRSELQSRVLGELSDMEEMQKEIRETTEAQAPRVAKQSRTAEMLVAGLSKRQAELGDRVEQFVLLTEETEFGVAMPTALRVLARDMRTVQTRLAERDASPRAIQLEKRVEEDLKSLIEAIRRVPPTSPPPPGSRLPTDVKARERELNRMIGELKMIRLLQIRLNDDTQEVDGGRPRSETLPPALRRQIEGLGASQQEIRDAMRRVGAPLETRPDEDDETPTLIDR